MTSLLESYRDPDFVRVAKTASLLKEDLFTALVERCQRLDLLVRVVTTEEKELEAEIPDLNGLTPEDFEPDGQRIPIYIRMMTGKTLTLYVSLEYTVEDVKVGTYFKCGVLPEDQRLIFAGQQLDYSRTLADYGVTKMAIFHLCLRLRGGMFHASSGRSDLHTSYVLHVTIPTPAALDKRVQRIDLYVHDGVTIQELTKIIAEGAKSVHADVDGRTLMIDNVPLVCEDLEHETIGDLHLSDGNKDGTVCSLSLI